MSDISSYLCGDCGESREEENIEMKKHSNEKLGKFPICQDKECSIENVQDHLDDSDDENEYKVEEPLE